MSEKIIRFVLKFKLFLGKKNVDRHVLCVTRFFLFNHNSAITPPRLDNVYCRETRGGMLKNRFSLKSNITFTKVIYNEETFFR